MTIPQAINNGYASTYLCVRYNDKQALFSGGALAAPTSPVTIQMVTDALSWGYDGGSQTAPALNTVKNYLIWLIGKFGLEASVITGSGGSVIPIVPTITTPARMDFVVSGSSPIPSGGSSLLLTNFIGYQVDFVRGGISQSTINTEPSYFSFNSLTGSFSCYPVLQAGELVALIPS